jgi:hypothetical protein
MEIIETSEPSVTGITSDECSSMDDNTCNSDDDMNSAVTLSGNVHSIIAWIEETQNNNFIPFITNDQIMIDNNGTVIVNPTPQILLLGGTMYTAVNPTAAYPCACQRV